MTRIVVDASIIAAILFDDEVSRRDDPVWEALRDSDFDIPSHWTIEFTSLLLKAERRGRMTRSRRDEHFAAASRLLSSAQVDRPPVSRAVIDLASDAGLTGYDAAYLELALRLGATLASNDDALVAACRARGVRVLTTRP